MEALTFAVASSVLSSPQPTAPPPARRALADKFIGFVEQPLRSAPKGKIDGAALLLVVEGRKAAGFLEGRPVVVINPEIERVVPHHPDHNPVAEHAGLAEHAPHGYGAERTKLFAQE